MIQLDTHKKSIADITRNHVFAPEYRPMPDYTMFPQHIQDIIRTFYETMKDRGLSVNYVKTQMFHLRRCLVTLQDAGLEIDPKKMTLKEIQYLRDYALTDLSLTSIHEYIRSIQKLARFCGNPTIPDVAFPSIGMLDDNMWLTSEQARTLLDAPLDVMTKTVVMLELCMGLRKCEVIRLTVDNLSDDRLYVRGKGRGGGKYRTIPYSIGVKEQLEKALEHREEVIAWKRRINPDITVPNNLFLAEDTNTKALHAYTEDGSAFDARFMSRLEGILNINVTNHMLRRTFARQLWSSGTDILVISAILGHENTRTTIKYIGVNAVEMSMALKAMDWSINACAQ